MRNEGRNTTPNDNELLQGVCKDCGSGTLNNELNPAFEVAPDPYDEEGYCLQCIRCGSFHVDAVVL